MSSIQRKPIRKSRKLLHRQKSSVGVMCASSLSSQSNITEQQQTNGGEINGVQTSIFPSYRNKLSIFTSPQNQPFSIGVDQYPSLQQNEAAVSYPRTLTPTNVRRMRSPKASSFTTSLDSKSSIHLLTNSRKSNLIFPSSKIIPTREQTQQQTISKIKQNQSISTAKKGSKTNGRRNRKKCRICSRYCCLASIPLVALLLIGFAAMFVGLSTVGKTTTTRTTTTSTTSTSTTSTTSTSTTSTSTSTSTTSTSSTSTTSTTASTTSTTSETTTTSTTADPCGTPTPIGSTSNLFSTTSSISSYNCEYYQWVSPTSGTVTLAFQFRNDLGGIGAWYMDDVSVSNGTTEMLLNGDFESGSLSPSWITSTPNGNCGFLTTGSQIATPLSCRTGTYCLSDGCGSHADQVSQSFVAVAGQTYIVSFWLKGGGGIGTISASVTLS